MKKNALLSIVLVAILTCSCATHQIKQAKDLSSSGIAYSDAVDNLIDVTIDKVIDFDTQELRKSRRGPRPFLKKSIEDKNEAISAFVLELERFRSQTKLLKSYFVNLQALANSSIKNDAGSAVQSLSRSISNLNTKLQGETKFTLSAEQQKEIGALGGLAANSIHAAKIKHALDRDAEVIGKYLCYQENQLQIIGSILKDRFEAQNDLFLNEKVISPYIDTNKTLGSSWDDNRKLWLKNRFVNQQLDTAQEAARQLRGVWGDIVTGKSDLNSLHVLISDMNEFVTTVNALKEVSPTK